MLSPSRPARLLLALLGALPACGGLDLASGGEVALTEQTTSGESGDASTGEFDSTRGIETSTAGGATHGADGTGDTGDVACDDDPACGPAESVATCPSQCSVCGDGIVSGDEDCDNGVNDSAVHYYFKPSSAACAPGCRKVAWCGDGKLNGPEPCDDAHKQTGGCEVDCSIPRCGDGLVNTHVDEACDDFNNFDGDGCLGDCSAVERSVFLYPHANQADFSPGKNNPDGLSGMALADWRCNRVAEIFHLRGTFKAWLSDSFTSPYMRFDIAFRGVYRLPLGYEVVARGWYDLTDGSIEHPIDRDMNASPVVHNVDPDDPGYYYIDNLVWSNTRPNGSPVAMLNCSNWTKSEVLSTTTVGYVLPTDDTWTSVLGGQSCINYYRYYCFEDPDEPDEG